MTPPTLDAEPACPDGRPPTPSAARGPDPPLRVERRSRRRHPAGDLGRARARERRGRRRSRAGRSSAPGGTPTARTPTRRRCVVCADGPARRRPGRDRPAHAPPRGRADRRADPHDDAPRRRRSTLTPVAADRQGGLLRRLVPRRLRDDPGRARPTCRPSPRRSPTTSPRPPATATRGTSSTSAACAAATRRPTRWPPPSARREIAEGWTLNVEREDVCPVVTLPAGVDIDGLPRDARQEGAPRDPAQGPPGRGRRRDPPDDSTDPLADLEAFIDLHQKRWGDDGLFPRHAGRRRRAGSSSAACSSSTAPTARCAWRS